MDFLESIVRDSVVSWVSVRRVHLEMNLQRFRHSPLFWTAGSCRCPLPVDNSAIVEPSRIFSELVVESMVGCNLTRDPFDINNGAMISTTSAFIHNSKG